MLVFFNLIGKIYRVFRSEDSGTLVNDVMKDLLGESVAFSKLLKGLNKSHRWSMGPKLMRGLLFSSTSLSVINVILDYGERNPLHGNRGRYHSTS